MGAKRATARLRLVLFATCMYSVIAAAQLQDEESSCRAVLGSDSPCCDKLEWLVSAPNAAPSDCLPGGRGTVLECMVLATGKRLPFDTGLYNLCQNTVSVNVSATYFLVRPHSARSPCCAPQTIVVCCSENLRMRCFVLPFSNAARLCMARRCHTQTPQGEQRRSSVSAYLTPALTTT